MILKNLADTQRLGKCLSDVVRLHRLPTILLHGDMGSGKTTLVRSLVKNLPNSDNAEVSSPSFTICNVYPTSPQVLHCDLFRCRQQVPDEIAEAMEDENILVLVEWAEYLPAWAKPKDFLDISFNMDNYNRLLNISSAGKNAKEAAIALFAEWSKF